MAKPNVTRTYGPIHFEDLDPHRFEDLIRELIYDYKDWQSIEATGRAGSDDGFDIRAYEKAEINSRTEEETGDMGEEIHPMEGNLWMIQGKREKEIGPKKIKNIIAEIDAQNPPYGYILAGSTDFSKKSYDVFREELRKKGVMEFYLWGKAELEDMLHLPKNDRILFTFFGISLVSKRRSKATEVRSVISVKNKLFKTVGVGENFHQSILIRDLNDVHYPYMSEYKDFEKKPRWREYIAFKHHPLGLWCHTHKYFAYVDTVKKEWDFTGEVDLIRRELEFEEERISKTEKRKLVEGVWKFFPRRHQGYIEFDCLIEYSNIAVIDDKGDVLYSFPHLYASFEGENGPFSWFEYILEVGGKQIRLTDEYKRIRVFPTTFQKPRIRKIHEKRKVAFDPITLKRFKEYGPVDTIYETDGKYDFLHPKDVISIADTNGKSEKLYIQITQKFKAKIKDYLEQVGEEFRIRQAIEQQLDRQFKDSEEINIYEFQRIAKWELESNRSNPRIARDSRIGE